jgi:hypothetical protein
MSRRCTQEYRLRIYRAMAGVVFDADQIRQRSASSRTTSAMLS